LAFVGNNGTLIADRSKWEIIAEQEGNQPLIQAPPVSISKENGLARHTKNWLDCIRSRGQTNCTIEMGRNAAVTAQMGNIAFRLNRKVSWNEEKGLFINDNKANELAKAHYRNGWKLPKV
jgi:hypothetical protein